MLYGNDIKLKDNNKLRKENMMKFEEVIKQAKYKRLEVEENVAFNKMVKDTEFELLKRTVDIAVDKRRNPNFVIKNENKIRKTLYNPEIKP